MKMKIKYLMMLLIMSVSSLVFVSCSDDDPDEMGPVAVNSCQVSACNSDDIAAGHTGYKAAIVWTLVPNSNCDGYIITLYKGTRANPGQQVEQYQSDFRNCYYTFYNLAAGTDYVISTQAIPSKTSGFSSAQMYWKEFSTPAN